MAGLRGQRGAPSTPFTSKLSPRQIATKAMTLGCKKLDRDDKRTRPQYNVRERLLLCNTIAHAEQVLNQRTRRTNRRVMSMEDDDTYFDQSINTPKDDDDDKPRKKASQQQREEHSPLRASSSSDEEEEEEEEQEDRSSREQPPQHTYTGADYLTGYRNLVNLGSPIVAL
ncbi:hypothetical protein [Absidia glauca]|uniref:Uncharacterized protein n=1 Tax=Absidia glauca TaxID=4829 RepID=A0A168LYQ7_ABSGL|nr:hypothetical protein [Absidia glauca]